MQRSELLTLAQSLRDRQAEGVEQAGGNDVTPVAGRAAVGRQGEREDRLKPRVNAKSRAEPKIAEKELTGAAQHRAPIGQVGNVEEVVSRPALALRDLDAEQAMVPLQEPVEHPVVRPQQLRLREQERPGEVRPVTVVKVLQSEAGMQTSYTGDVRPRYESALGFRVAGKIVARKVEVGSRVRRDQELARLAKSKGMREEVQQFAARMERDHSGTYRAIEEIAASKRVEIPSAPSEDAREEAKELEERGRSITEAVIR